MDKRPACVNTVIDISINISVLSTHMVGGEASHLYVHTEFWEVARLKRDENNGNLARFTLVGGLPLLWFTHFLYGDLKLQGA